MGSKLIKTDDTYRSWIREVSSRFRKSQIKAAVKVNEEMLRFYWSVGRDISAMHMDAEYGSGFYKAVSTDLKDVFPDVHSFSITNLKYMKYFYELFPNAAYPSSVTEGFQQLENRQQLVDDLRKTETRQQAADVLGEGIVFFIPWGHHIFLLDKCKNNRDKALFYVHKTIENNWSRAVLMNIFDTGLYERQGKAMTNFARTLPAEQSDLAQAITKDPYNFDFLTIRDKYDEKELKDALMDRVQNFLMELGTGFAYMGREVSLKVGRTEKFLDMLFYNTQRHCYVVVEVKAGKFDSSDSGQLGTYVVAVNHQLKTEQDNPTLGLLVCKDLDKVEAQYALEASSQPLGISRYELTRLIPEDFKGSMPTIEEIEAELSDPEGGQGV